MVKSHQECVVDTRLLMGRRKLRAVPGNADALWLAGLKSPRLRGVPELDNGNMNAHNSPAEEKEGRGRTDGKSSYLHSKNGGSSREGETEKLVCDPSYMPSTHMYSTSTHMYSNVGVGNSIAQVTCQGQGWKARHQRIKIDSIEESDESPEVSESEKKHVNLAGKSVYQRTIATAWKGKSSRNRIPLQGGPSSGTPMNLERLEPSSNFWRDAESHRFSLRSGSVSKGDDLLRSPRVLPD
ncbi:hypothetical protein B0H19DRAFT_1071616 [Mycena capillaripes]|nr:hypothetical protein B0H19DRAFT_1071616 [Mycena capillaripes]